VPRTFSPTRLIGAGLLLLAVVVVALILIPSKMYILLPDPAHPVSAAVTVPPDKAKPDSDAGGIYFVDVFERKATLLERLFPGIRKGSTLVPASQIISCGSTAQQDREINQRMMTQSQQVAALVALRALGYKVKVAFTGVLVTQVACDGPAVGKLQATEIITAIDGKAVHTLPQLRAIMAGHAPGDVVRLTVRGSSGLRAVSVKTIADPQDRKRALIGILVPEQAFEAKLPFPVRINAGSVGGPSAGLAFSLDVMEKLGRDVDHGYRVAATGTIDPDGSVGPIGGVKQKTYGARDAHVDVFLVPAGENAREARRYAKGLRIIPVESFRQALRALATLPAKG
jgi:PDZ domain-containing protein